MELESAIASLNRTGQARLADQIDFTGPPTKALSEAGYGNIAQLLDSTDLLGEFSIEELQFATRTYVLKRFLASKEFEATLWQRSASFRNSSKRNDSLAFSADKPNASSSIVQYPHGDWIVPEVFQDTRGAPITSLGLSVRAQNVLTRLGLETVDDVLNIADTSILHSPNCGIKTLSEIKTKIFNFLSGSVDKSASGEGEVEEPDALIQQLNVNPAGWRLPPEIKADVNTSLDHIVLSQRARTALRQFGAKTVNDVLQLPKPQLYRLLNCGRITVKELQDRISEFLSGDLHKYFGIASESDIGGGATLGFKLLVDRMLGLLDKRARTVVADRYGLWDGISETLQEIGDKLGCTRERVRQIEAKSLRRLRQAVPTNIEPLLLQKVLRWTSLSGTNIRVVAADELARAMADDCNQEEADLGIRFIDDLFGLIPIFKQDLWEAEEGVYARNEEDAQRYYELVVRARKVLGNLGTSTSIVSLRNALQSDGQYAATDVDRVLHVSPSFIGLRNDSVALNRWPAYKRRTIGALCVEALNKVKRPAHFSEIAKIAGTLDPEGRDVNEGTLHNELVRDSQTFVWVKQGTYGLAQWGLKRAPFLKDKLIELLSKSHYPLPYWHLEEEALAVCNCKPTSVRMTLDLNPRVFAKYSDNQYGLKSRK